MGGALPGKHRYSFGPPARTSIEWRGLLTIELSTLVQMDLFRTELLSPKSTYSSAEGRAGRAHSSARTIEGAHLELSKRGDAGEGTPDAVSPPKPQPVISLTRRTTSISSEHDIKGVQEARITTYHHA